MRCPEREGVLDGGRLVRFLRVFKPTKARQRGKAFGMNFGERRN